MSDSEILERWIEDDTPLYDAARVKEHRAKRCCAPWAEVFARIAQGIEWQIMDDGDAAARELGYGSYSDMNKDWKQSRL